MNQDYKPSPEEAREIVKADIAKHMFDKIPAHPSYIHARRMTDDKNVRLTKGALMHKGKVVGSQVYALFLGTWLNGSGQLQAGWKKVKVPNWELQCYKVTDERIFTDKKS